MAIDNVGKGGNPSALNGLNHLQNNGLGVGQTGQTQEISSNPQDLSVQQQNLAAQGSAWNAMNGGSGSGMIGQGDMMDPSKMRLAGTNGSNYFAPPNGGSPLPIDIQSSGFNPSTFQSNGQMSGIINDMGLGSIFNDPHVPMYAKVVILFMASAKDKLEKNIDKLADTELNPTTGKDGTNTGTGTDGQTPSQEILTAEVASDSRDLGRTQEGAGSIVKTVDDKSKAIYNNIRA